MTKAVATKPPTATALGVAPRRLRLAIREECVARIDGAEPELIELVRKIMHDANEQGADHLRAATRRPSLHMT